MDNKQRILPVLDDGRLAGVITRTDLLNVLVGRDEAPSTLEPLRDAFNPRRRNITRFMQERLPRQVMSRLREIGTVADALGCGAYVVGGFVRDLFLYRGDEDLDIVIEGDGIAFAREYGRIAGARIHTHEKFGTAVIIYPDGFTIDVASARMEYYKFPAALPVVEMSSIKLDLYRRDFTINTLTIQLNPDRFGILIDFFNAQKDIKEKAIRVLHNLSFVEDPTRVFRAIRFEQRFGFTIGRLTAGLIHNAVRMDFFRELSGRRVFNELQLILQEENPAAAVARLNDFGLLRVVHPALVCDKHMLRAAERGQAGPVLVRFAFPERILYEVGRLFSGPDPALRQRQQAQEICSRFELTPRLQALFVEGRAQAEECLHGLTRRLPADRSTLYRQLSGFRTELVLFMMAAAEQEKVKKALSHYVTTLRRTTISLKGQDLKELGVAPGPIYREVLQAVLDARLNGRVQTRKEELALARTLIRGPA